MPANIFQELKSHLNPKECNEGCFIFQVEKISSYNPELSSEVEAPTDNVDDASSYFTLDFDEALIRFQGRLVTYFLYDRLTKDDE